MKKQLVILILFVMICFLVGCENTSKTTTQGTDLATTTAQVTTTNMAITTNGADIPRYKKVADSFVLAIIPDSQKLAQKYPSVFKAQTQWIADNAKDYNIKLTISVGDIVQNAQYRSEWQNASDAYKILDDAMVPYAVVAGNHDIVGNMSDMYRYLDNDRPDHSYFLEYFPKSRMEKFSETFGGISENGWNSYYYFEADDRTFMVLMFDYAASDETFLWANQLLKDNAHIPTIVVTHRLTNPVGEEGAAEVSCAKCKDLFDKLIFKNDNVFMAISGHWVGSGYTMKTNIKGRNVIMYVVDYSDWFRGGNGLTRLIEFDLKTNQIYNTTISPYVMNIPIKERTEQDKVELIDKANKFTISFNFQERLNLDN